jgi:hypothetical protein
MRSSERRNKKAKLAGRRGYLVQSIPVYQIGILVAGVIALRIATGWFNSELRKTDPKLYERVGRPGDSNVDWGEFKAQLRFLLFLMSGGYLKLNNRRLMILGAIQHVWLIAVIGFVVYTIATSFNCSHC